MATLAQLEQALINADRAGRTEDARILAQELQRAMGGAEVDPFAAQAEIREQLRRSSPEESGFIENVLSGFGSGVVGTGEMAALGAAALLEEEDELAARDKIKAAAESFRPEGGDQDSLAYKISSGVGSVAGALGAAAAATYGAGALGVGAVGAGLAGLGTAGAIGVGAGAGEASERARAAGATEEERAAATRRGAAIGSLEVLPLGRILKIPGVSKLAEKIGGKAVEEGGSRIRSALTTGGAEAAQEASAAFLQNLNERGYNVEKELLDAGIIDEAIAGGGAGAIVQGVVDFFVRGKTPRRTATEIDSEAPETAEVEVTEPTRTEDEIREAEAASLEARALAAADRGDERKFEQAAAEAAQPDLFPRELEKARKARPEAALRGQLESEGAERVPQREGIREEPKPTPPQPIPVQEDMIDRLDKMEIDDAEIAEIEAMLQADEQAVAELDRMRGESELETMDARRKGDQARRSTDKRYSILQKTIEENPTRNYNTLSKNFEKALKAEGIKKTKATESEIKTIRRAVNVQRAEKPEPPTTPEITPPPEATQLAEMEARIPERKERAPVTPSQLSFPGMGRRKTPPVKETPPAPKTVTKEFMDGLGISPAAPIRKRTEGKDLNDPAIREQFVKFANNPKVGQQARLNVARELEGVPEAQLELFQPQPRGRVAAVQGGPDARIREPQPVRGGVSVPTPRPPVGETGGVPARPRATEVPTAPRRGRVASARRSVGEPVRGATEQQLTLDLPEPIAAPKVETPKPTRKAAPKKRVAKKKAPTQPREAQELTTTRKQVTTKEPKRTTSTTRKVMPTLQVKKTTPALAPKDNATKQLRAKFEEQNEQTQKYATELSKDFQDTVGDEKTSVDDRLKILTLLTGGAKARDKDGNAVVTYLSKYPRPTDGLYAAIYDVANQSPQFRRTNETTAQEAAIFEGTGKKTGQRVLDWAKANLSDKTNKWIDETLANEIREMQRIENTDYVEMFRQRDAKLAAKEAAEQAQIEAEMRQDVRASLNELARMFEKKLERGSVMALDIPLHPAVRVALRENNLQGALSSLAATTPDNRVRQIATKLSKVAGDTKIEIVKDMKDAGSFDPETNTIKLDADEGMNPHVLLHEATHAATSATLGNKNHPLTRQLTNLYNDVKDYLDTAYGAKDVDEFVSEAMSNPEFQAKLAAINPNGEKINALQRFYNSVGNFLRKLVGMQPKKIDSAQTMADRLIDGILAPAPDYRNAPELAMESTADGVKREANAVGDAQKAVSQPTMTKQGKAQFGDTASNVMSSLGEARSWLVPKLLDAQALADAAYSVSDKLGAVATKFYETADFMRGDMGKAHDKVREQIKVVDQWRAKAGKEGQAHLDNLIYNESFGATIYQVDPNKKRSDYEGQTDESGNDLAKVWDAQRADWKALGASGQNAYRTMQKMYRAQFEELKAVIDGRIDRLLENNPDAATELKNEVFSKLFENKTLDVYFPLLREGRYKIEYTFKNAKDGRDTYVFQMMDNKAQRDRLAEELRADPDVVTSSVKTGDGDFRNYDFSNAPSTSFVGNVIKILDENGKGLQGAEKDAYDENKADIMNLFIDALPESSFAKSLQRRKGTPGYMTDSIYAMKTKGFDLARQIEKLKYTAQFQQLEAELAEVQGEPPQGADYKFNQIADQLQTRINFAKYGAKNKGVEQFVRFANQTAFVYTLGGNVASAAVQLFQTPMFTFPMLGARYGYQKTYDEIMNASSIVTGAKMNAETIKEATGLRGKAGAATRKISIAHGLDSYYDVTDNGDFVVKKDLGVPDERVKELERLAPLVQLMHARGHLNRSFLFDQLGIEEGGKARRRGGLGQQIANAIDFGTGASALIFNQSERYNRQVTAVASYNLALERITAENPKMPLRERQDKAAVEALYDTQEYNGGSTLETAPRIAQEGLGRVAMMYKTYGLRMYYNMIKTMRQLADNAFASDAEGKMLRNIALKQMIGIHGSALFFAGIHGIPLYGAVQLLADAFLLGDEDDDFNSIVRNYVGEGWYKGAFNQILDQAGVGADVASRVRLTGLLIQENRYNTEPSPEEFLGFYLGGPALSIYKRIDRGITDLRNGEFERGFENIMPTAISNGYKALGRYRQDGGIYSRRVDPIYDDMTGGELFAQMLGFAPAEYLRIQEENQRVKHIDIELGRQRSNLTKKYYVAARQGDWAEIARLEQEILEFNRKHPSFELTLDAINRSLEQHMKTSEEMYNGVSLSPAMRRAAEEHLYGVRNGFMPPVR